jgi:glycine/serine hydroxymethyltransferase
MGPAEMREIGRIIHEAVVTRDEPAEQARLAAETAAIAGRFPVPGLPAA